MSEERIPFNNNILYDDNFYEAAQVRNTKNWPSPTRTLSFTTAKKSLPEIIEVYEKDTPLFNLRSLVEFFLYLKNTELYLKKADPSDPQLAATLATLEKQTTLFIEKCFTWKSPFRKPQGKIFLTLPNSFISIWENYT